MKRIRKLVDNAYNTDPRIAQFKEEDKQEKLAKKKAKQDAAKARREEEEKRRREEEEKERLEREKKEAEEKAKSEEAKKEREAIKKALKKEKKTLRTLCKENDFYAQDEDQKVAYMAEVDKLCEVLSGEELEVLNKDLKEKGKQAFLEIIEKVNHKLDKEKLEMMEKSAKSGSGDKSGSGSSQTWSSDELALLIKAVNLFPAGKYI